MKDLHKKLDGATVLVTGGAGFIGSHLCDKLIDSGAKVICFDNLSTGNSYYVSSQKNNPNFIFIHGDANKLNDLEKVFFNFPVDYIMHYAAVVGVQKTIEEPLAVLNDIECIKHICELASKYDVKKIVFASSSEIYGAQEKVPFHEEYSYNDTKHPYALVKAISESYLKTHWEVADTPFTSLRFFNVYGPRQASSRYGFVTGIFISQVLRNEPPTIFRDGKQTRDFTYIDDNVEAAVLALLSDKTNGEVLNIGTGVETSVLELAEKIITISGKKLKPKLLRSVNPTEAQRRVADTTKLKELLEFEHKTSLDEGLKSTYKWYEGNPHLLMKKEDMGYDKYEKHVWEPHHNNKRKK